jgi:hypothetical protein
MPSKTAKSGSTGGKGGNKRTVISFKDVEIAYLLDGITGVERLLSGRKSAAAVLRRALRDLKEQGRAVDALESYIADKYGSSGRGRSVPTPGEERRYKAQQIKQGGAFLRLPLNVLGVGKGQNVRVRFERDRIVVSKA